MLELGKVIFFFPTLFSQFVRGKFGINFIDCVKSKLSLTPHFQQRRTRARRRKKKTDAMLQRASYSWMLQLLKFSIQFLVWNVFIWLTRELLFGMRYWISIGGKNLRRNCFSLFLMCLAGREFLVPVCDKLCEEAENKLLLAIVVFPYCFFR